MNADARTGRRYYQLVLSAKPRRQWHLAEPRDATGKAVPTWTFSKGERVNLATPLYVPLWSPGVPIDFSMGAFEVIVVTEELGFALDEVASKDIQLIPARVESMPAAVHHFVLNVLTYVPCIDEEASGVTHFDPRAWPDRGGQISGVAHLRIDPTKVSDARIFRVAEWEPAVVVSEEVYQLLRRRRTTGIEYVEV